MPRNWHKARLLHRELAGPRAMRLWIHLYELDRYDYEPGQFITFDLPTGTKRIDRWRSYSIASAPDGSAIIELAILYMPGGKASEYFFHQIQDGDELSLQGPKGIFTRAMSAQEPRLHDQISETSGTISRHVMICTGTGVVPYRSILRDMNARGIDEPVHLIYGARTAAELLYTQEWARYERSMLGFRFTACLSREDHPDHTSGYVHQVYQQEYADHDPQRIFYLCGWSQMIDEAMENLIALGNDPHQIRVELYG